MTGRERVSIIVLCRNRWAETERCLQALRRTAPASLYELLVFDNASSDGTHARLKRLARTWPQLRVFRNSKNLSFARAVNRGMREASGDYFLWLNNDTVPTPGWLAGLLAAAAEEGVGAVGPMTDHMAPPDQLIPMFANPHRPESLRDAQALGGFCFLVKRRAAESVGELDERFVWGWEDMDYCFRLRQSGWRLRIAGGVLVRHTGNATMNDLPRAPRTAMDKRNRRLILAKWNENDSFRRDLWDLFERFRSPWAEPRLAAASIIQLGRGGFGNPGAPHRESMRLPFRDAKRVENLNLALRRARGRYIVLLEDGKLVRDGWLKRLMTAAVSRPHVGVVGLAPGRAAGPAEAAYVAPGCLLIDRGALTAIGEFDIALSWDLSWADFCLRILQAGYHILEIGGLARTRAGALTPTARDRELLARKWLDGHWRKDDSQQGFWKDRLPNERLAPDYEIFTVGAAENGDRAHAVNLASRRARGRYIVLLEEGNGVRDDRLARLLLAARSLHNVGIVGAAGRTAGPVETSFVPPGCLLIDRGAIAAVGEFDERLSWSLSWADFCLRVLQAGYRILAVGGISGGRGRVVSATPRDRGLLARKWFDGHWRKGNSQADFWRERIGLTPELTVVGMPEALQPSLKGKDYEIVAMDATSDRSRAHALNLALRQARGRHIVLLEDGKNIRDGRLERLIKAARSKPHVGIVGAGANRAAGISQASYVPPGCLLIDRAALAEAGEFDAALSWDLSWADFCLRVLQAGYRILAVGGISSGRTRALIPTPRERDHLNQKWFAGYWRRNESERLFWKERFPTRLKRE